GVMVAGSNSSSSSSSRSSGNTSSSILKLLVLLSTVALLVTQAQAGLDCRKFVFAPQCRGIIAKRTPTDKHTTMRQWDIAQYRAAAAALAARPEMQEDIYGPASYDDVSADEDQDRDHMAVVRENSDASLQVPSYVYSILERRLHNIRK
ncbi:unnamed protein product, partial [Meganyctiphanes norvegica]